MELKDLDRVLWEVELIELGNRLCSAEAGADPVMIMETYLRELREPEVNVAGIDAVAVAAEEMLCPDTG